MFSGSSLDEKLKIFYTANPGHYEVQYLNQPRIQCLVTRDKDAVDSWIHKVEQELQANQDIVFVGLATNWRRDECPVDWQPSLPEPGDPQVTIPSSTREVKERYNEHYPPAILQLCVGLECLIFQLLPAKEIPQSLTTFLNNPLCKFVTAHPGILKLIHTYDLRINNLRNLNSAAVRKFADMKLYFTDVFWLGYKVLDTGISGIWAMSRYAENSRWDDVDLSVYQIKYACLQVLIATQVAKALEEFLD